MGYVGRFAPSPTGPLHYGSLVAALASYLDARANNGAWLLRIEDLDPPRESAEAPGQITTQLTAFGLHWDGDILFQSTRLQVYSEVVSRLTRQGLTYHCTCSRKQTPPVYPGTCRGRTTPPAGRTTALRIQLPDSEVVTNDRRLGRLAWHLTSDVGDFIIRRKDGLDAYQLAVVVDDIYQQVTHVVRGVDLLDSTPRQLALYNLLGITPPVYLHIPIIVDGDGDKLSKQTRAAPVPTSDPMATLRHALGNLGQSAQPAARDVAELLARATENWDTSLLPAQENITVPDGYR